MDTRTLAQPADQTPVQAYPPREAMQRYVLVARFLAGAFLCNAVPHLLQGLTGQQFPTPFAGGGLSSPLINVVWGTANLAAGGFLLGIGGLRLGRNRQTLLAAIGFVGTAISLALVFGAR